MSSMFGLVGALMIPFARYGWIICCNLENESPKAFLTRSTEGSILNENMVSMMIDLIAGQTLSMIYDVFNIHSNISFGVYPFVLNFLGNISKVCRQSFSMNENFF